MRVSDLNDRNTFTPSFFQRLQFGKKGIKVSAADPVQRMMNRRLFLLGERWGGKSQQTGYQKEVFHPSNILQFDGNISFFNAGEDASVEF